MIEQSEFERIGGRQSLIKINKAFYDKVYAHPWLKLFFESVPQQHIEDQQVDFMQKVLGGENRYWGKAPPIAHVHINITEEVFAVRNQLLEEAFIETNAHPELIEKWRQIDNSFKRILLKKSLKECKGRFNSDPILDFPKPK